MLAYQATGSFAGPAIGGFAITPDDTDLAAPTRAIWVGTAGDLRVTFVNGDVAVFESASGLLPIAVRRVWSTGTTADAIVGLV